MKWFLWILIVIGILVVLAFLGRVKKRGWLMKDRKGKEVTGKEFMKRWWLGCTSLTPAQQTRTVLWSLPPIFAGQMWGIAVTLISGVYWMSWILGFALPITFVNFVGTIQKYRAQIKAQKAYEEAMKND